MKLKFNQKIKDGLVIASIYVLLFMGIFGISARAKWFNETQKKTEMSGTQISQKN